MVRMVFSAQLGRSSVHPLLYRIGMITSADDLKVHTFGSDSRVGAILALGFAITMALAWLVRPVRPFVLLVVAQLAVLLLSPPFYAFYSDYLAVPAALVVAGAATACLVRGRARAGRSLAAWVPVAAALALTVGVLSTTPAQVTKFAHRAQMAGAARRARCVVSNTPMALIDLDALTRSFAPGCADRVDVTAAAFGVVNPSDRVLPHHPNRVWHADLYRYLTSGNAVIIVGARWISLGAADLARIDRHPVLASNGPDTLYATPGRH
jgi:alpha-1,2-mannosyltransferase